MFVMSSRDGMFVMEFQRRCGCNGVPETVCLLYYWSSRDSVFVMEF